MAKRHHWLNEIDNFLDKKDLQMEAPNTSLFLVTSAMHLPYHGFVESQTTKPEKNLKPENITEEIREKEAEKIAFKHYLVARKQNLP